MFFEAVEKKLEITVKDQCLFDLKESFWEALVQSAKAQVISQISTPTCRAYLLSESTLLVWPHRMTLVTCGQTSLVSATLYFLNKVKKENVKNIVFERKNEKNPHQQSSCFFGDIEEINKIFKGHSYCFQSQGGPLLYLYETDKKVDISSKDKTLEILSHDIGSSARDFLTTHHRKEEIREFFGIDKIFKNFEVDDFVFKPFGYSLNALLEEFYYTIHVSPQEEASYMSFETNCLDLHEEVLFRILNVLRPRTCEVILFSKNSQLSFRPIEGYFQSNLIETSLNSGYKFDYLQFCQKEAKKIFYEKNQNKGERYV